MKKIVFICIIIVASLFFVGVAEARAGCCVCGDINDDDHYYLRDLGSVEECESKCTFNDYFWDPNCLMSSWYGSNSNIIESPDCCIFREKLGQRDIKQCWSNYPYHYCKEPQEFTMEKTEWYEVKCSEVEGCDGAANKHKLYDYYDKLPKEKPEPERETRLTYFIPQINIPFSDKFNQGEPVIITGATLGEYIVAVFVFGISIAGILTVVMIMYGGIKYIISMGNPQKISDAQDTIVSAMLGLALALGSYAILLTINPNLVQFMDLGGGVKAIPRETAREYEKLVESEKGSTARAFRGINVSKYDELLTKAADKYKIQRDYLKAIMLVESAGDPTAVSPPPAGACGLMQVLPSTAKQYDGTITCGKLKQPEVAIDIGAHYFSELLDFTCPFTANYKDGTEAECIPATTKCLDGIEKWAIAAYNGGPGANCSSISCPGLTWWECEVNYGFAETRAYVQKVNEARLMIKEHPDFKWTYNL